MTVRSSPSQRPLQRGAVFLHDGEIGRASLCIRGRHGLHGIHGQDLLVLRFAGSDDGFGDLLVGSVDGADRWQFQLVQLRGQELDRFEAGLRLRLASRKGCIVLQAVILRQIPEWEPE